MDSAGKYTEIGHVKKKDKGVQAFVDGHPSAGKNFYKLSIVFNSGLSWSSNHCAVFVDKASLDKLPAVLPANDSLQKYIVTQDLSKNATSDTIASAIKRNSKEIAAPRKESVKQTDQSKSTLVNNIQAGKQTSDTAKHSESKPRISVSFTLDSNDVITEIVTGTVQAVHEKKKITVTFEEPNSASTDFITSRFIFTDSVTGHIDMFLPDDVKTHHYSVKFYDAQNHVIIDLPRINTAKIIIDKRNFQHEGMYKFILRRDVTEFERGYIEIE